MRRMTVLRKILLGYVVLIVLIAGISATMIYTAVSNSQKQKDLRDDVQSRQDQVTQLKLAVKDQVNGLRAELLVKLTGGGTLVNVNENADTTKTILAALQKRTGQDAESKDALGQIADLLSTFNKASEHVLALAGAGRFDEAAVVLEQEAFPAADLLDKKVGVYSGLTAAGIKKQEESLDGKVRRANIISGILAGVAIVVGIILAIAIPRQIGRQLKDATARLGTSTAEMLAVTSQVAAGAVQTATAISEAATTVDEVRQTSLLASQKATAVSDSAQQADQVAEGGRRAVGETLEGIRRIQEQMQVVADSVVRLSEQTEAVSEIIATSNDIAEQSNLLSVNAAIEAAKASEQGKGFSVVAEEIKNLAQQSKQGVMQVRSILNDIQRATSAAVMAAEQSSRSIEEGASQALESSQAIESLAEGVAAAAQSAMQIVASAQQQLVGMDQISEAMASIDQASAQNASGARQMETEVQHLQDLAISLRAMVDTRLDETAFVPVEEYQAAAGVDEE